VFNLISLITSVVAQLHSQVLQGVFFFLGPLFFLHLHSLDGGSVHPLHQLLADFLDVFHVFILLALAGDCLLLLYLHSVVEFSVFSSLFLLDPFGNVLESFLFVLLDEQEFFQVFVQNVLCFLDQGQRVWVLDLLIDAGVGEGVFLVFGDLVKVFHLVFELLLNDRVEAFSLAIFSNT